MATKKTAKIVDETTADSSAPAAPKKNWMAKLAKLDGAIDRKYNPHSRVVRSPSPSVNYIYGNNHGIPFGYTEVKFGVPKGGKSVLTNFQIGQLHKDDPEAIVVRYDTEMRDEASLTDESLRLFGIDPDRFISFSTNSAEGVFDHFNNDVVPMIQDGAPIRMVVIDSITGIMGRRAAENDSVLKYTIGDQAMTLQIGFQSMLQSIRKYRIFLALVAHVRAEMDPLEVKKGNKYKMAAAFGVKHFAEYFTYVERWDTVAGRADLLGNEFEDGDRSRNMTDVAGSNSAGELTGHKIRVTMKDSTFGPKGRTGAFLFDYKKGIINTHEEVFLLGYNNGIITLDGQMYCYKENRWRGKPGALGAIKASPELEAMILADVYARDTGKHGEEAGDVEFEEPPAQSAPEV